jgi:PAS domain S-box-containing protein
MKNDIEEVANSSESRIRAEERLLKKQSQKGIPPPEDNLKLIHELQVHQIELEMQNEELMQARADLEASLEKYSDLYNFAPTGYFSLTDKGVIIEVNLKGAALLGKDRSNLINHCFDYFVSNKTQAAFSSFLQKVFESDTTETCEVALSTTKEKPKYLHIEGEAILPHGSLNRQCCISAMDITERKEAEEALKNKDARLQLAHDAAHAGTWEWNLKTNANVWSKELWKLYRLDPHGFEPSCESWLQSIHPDDRLEAEQALRIASGNGTELYAEWRVLDADGSVHWLMSRGRPSPGESGEVERYIGIVMDITERKQAEEELNRYHANLEALVMERTNELEQRNIQLKNEINQRKQAEKENLNLLSQLIQTQKMDALGRFAGGIAHEMNNFLYPVLVNTQMLLEESSPNSSFHQTLEQSLKALYRQRDLIRQILSFSRKGHQQFIPVHVKPLVKEALAMLKSLIPSTIKFKQSMDSPFDTVLGDPTQIQQIIINLCTNAVDAMGKETGKIEVRLSKAHLEPYQQNSGIKEGEYLCLTVKDSGFGMTEEVMSHIFEPFFTTKEIGKGTGMGLAVIHAIIKNHGGIITVNSEPGKGSLFTVYMPLMAVDTLLEKKEVCPNEGKRTILLIDDEEIILKSIRKVLKVLRYEVVTVNSGYEALEVFSRIPDCFDLVITDMAMPLMTGEVLAGKLHKIRSDIPIILCTGLNDAVNELRAKEVGIRAILEKPADYDELKNAISMALESEHLNT